MKEWKLKSNKKKRVKKVTIWEEEHAYYPLHYHIKTSPPYPPKKLFELLKRKTREVFVEPDFKIHESSTNGYCEFQVRKCEEAGYSRRLFIIEYSKVTTHTNMFGKDKRHHKIHIKYEDIDALTKLIARCFPNAEIRIIKKSI